MPNYLKKEKVDLQRSIFSRAIEMSLNFKLRDKVLNLASFDELMLHFRESFPKNGLDIDILLNKIENELIPFSMNYASPYAMAFPDSGNATAGITGDILTAFLNQNLINWLPCSPVGTIIEMIVLNWFRELVGFPCQSDLKSPVDVGGG
jgi:glutamate/tyrosine decarboxylase-like PLP-dependent enzyme